MGLKFPKVSATPGITMKMQACQGLHFHIRGGQALAMNVCYNFVILSRYPVPTIA